MSRFPPKLRNAGAFFSVTAAGRENGMAPPPGVGNRIRVWAFGVAPHISTPNAVVDAFLQLPAGTAGQVHIDRTSGMVYFPGGLALAANAGLTLTTEATAAANIRLWVFYTIEPVA